MYCTKCGVENPEDSQVCRSCGERMVIANDLSLTSTKKTCGYAVTALVLGILSPFFAVTALVSGTLSPFSRMLTGLPAIIVGIIALVKIKKASGHMKGNGLAIAGICLPVVLLVLLPMMGAMMGTLMPALARTSPLAYRMSCGMNLSVLGKAMIFYCNDYEDKFPTASNWCDLLIENAPLPSEEKGRGGSYFSPAMPSVIFELKGMGESVCSYAMNKDAANLGVRAPPDMVILFETHSGWNQVGGSDILTTDNHQGDGCHVLFGDSHVEFVRASQIPELRWK